MVIGVVVDKQPKHAFLNMISNYYLNMVSVDKMVHSECDCGSCDSKLQDEENIFNQIETNRRGDEGAYEGVGVGQGSVDDQVF